MRHGSLLLVLTVGMAHAESVAGIQWNAPLGWKSEGPRPMRAATYVLPEGAECAVYYFGPGQGGSVDDNVKRWVGQFEEPGGKPASKFAKVEKKQINGIAATTIDVSGTYTGGGGPMAAVKTKQPNFRLLGAIVRAPQGNVFFKFTGPAKVVAGNQARFEEMLRSIKRR